MIPGLCVILAVLAFNFLGDGLRDAADPYHGRSRRLACACTRRYHEPLPDHGSKEGPRCHVPFP